MFRNFIIFTLLFAAGPAAAADQPATSATATDAGVGLVLSGGGARGAAHIGVLKYLEQHRIPVDHVVGTSVGAVIGGLYASGMSADEIEKLVVSLDWNEMFSDTAQPEQLDIRRKLQKYRYLVDIDAGIQDGELIFSTGFITGQNMLLMLRAQTLPVRGIDSFDELPTPFRAVATDLATARPVVFSNGDLVRAMRASMSVPGVYSAVEYHDTRLVDGGIVQNLPVPVARSLGAEALIAVDVATPLRPVDELNSPFDVTSQVMDGIMLNQSREMQKRLAPDDVLIAPTLNDFQSTSFDSLQEIIDFGYREAERHAGALSRFSVSEQAYAAWLQQRQSRRKPWPQVDHIVVSSTQDVSALVRGRLSQPLHEPLDVPSLDQDVEELFGLGLFGTVNYSVEKADDGGETLVLEAQPKDTGPLRFEAGVELQETFSGNTAFQLRAALNQVGINSLGAEWRNEIGLGTTTGITSEFYQPLSYSGHWFAAGHYTYALGELALQNEQGETGNFRLRENVLGADLGVNLWRWSTARVGVRYGSEDAFARDPADALFDDRSFDIRDLVFRFRHDSVNSFSFPSAGTRVDLRWERALEKLGAPEEGEYAAFDYLAAFGDGRDNILFGATLESVLSGERFLQQGVALGGVTRLSGFERDELLGRHAGLLRAVYYRYLGQDRGQLIDVPLYTGMTLEAGNVWQHSQDAAFDDLIVGASVFVAVDTTIGPISVAYGRNTDGKDTFYLSIGTINGPSFRQFRR